MNNKSHYRLLIVVLLGVELLPGAGAGLAHPEAGVYDVHAGPGRGVVTVGPLLEAMTSVTSASRQGPPPPVVRDLNTITPNNLTARSFKDRS